MDTIEGVLNKLTQYISELGLATWQLQVIGIGVVLILILTLIRIRKKKAKPGYKVQTRSRPDVIGIKLQDSQATHSHEEDAKRLKPVSTITKTTTYRKKTLKQTTNEWRKATEQIRQLRHELSKQKRTEEHLRQIIADLKSSSQKATVGTSESESQHISTKPEPSIPKSTDTQVREDSRSKPADEDSKQKSAEHTALIHDNTEAITEDEKKQRDSKGSGELMHTDVQDRQDNSEENKINSDSEKQITESLTNTEQYQQQVICTRDQEAPTIEDIEDGENSQQPGVPLDVKELKAIAELAKRLRGNDRQEQEK
jgi:hypothetical protein